MGDSPKPPRWNITYSKRATRSARVVKNRVCDREDDLLMTAAEQSVTLAEQTELWKGCCIHAVNGVELIADPAGIVYWPARQTLLVADLHLEKGSAFARRGQLVPPYDTAQTLLRLAAAIGRWCPDRVIALGDSFHDRWGAERLSKDNAGRLAELMNGRQWLWITGNHDPQPPADLGGDSAGEWVEDGLVLRHEPRIDGPTGEIAGHLHPKATLVRRGRHVRRSCFAASRSRMILPSFGAYTGGLNVFHDAFEGLFDGREFHALMRGRDQVYRIAARDLR